LHSVNAGTDNGIYKKAFDSIATEYNSQREFVIPDLKQFYTTAVWAA
jgi:hypothetical protein